MEEGDNKIRQALALHWPQIDFANKLFRTTYQAKQKPNRKYNFKKKNY
jgi:hypothetical protein